MRRMTGAMLTEKWLLFLLYVLKPRRTNGGWINVNDMARDLEISNATAYRWVIRAEAAGLPIARDMARSGGMVGAGFRCMLETRRRPDDTVPIEERRRPREALGKGRQTT